MPGSRRDAGIGFGDFDVLRREPRLVRLQLRDRAAAAFDHQHARRAARRRLETERAAAGEEIETALAVELLAEPVEKRLADAIGRGAQAVEIEHRQRRALPVAADDADRVRLAATRRRGSRTLAGAPGADVGRGERVIDERDMERMN